MPGEAGEGAGGGGGGAPHTAQHTAVLPGHSDPAIHFLVILLTGLASDAAHGVCVCG